MSDQKRDDRDVQIGETRIAEDKFSITPTKPLSDRKPASLYEQPRYRELKKQGLLLGASGLVTLKTVLYEAENEPVSRFSQGLLEGYALSATHVILLDSILHRAEPNPPETAILDRARLKTIGFLNHLLAARATIREEQLKDLDSDDDSLVLEKPDTGTQWDTKALFTKAAHQTSDERELTIRDFANRFTDSMLDIQDPTAHVKLEVGETIASMREATYKYFKHLFLAQRHLARILPKRQYGDA